MRGAGRKRGAAFAAAGYVVLTCLFYWHGVRHMASAYISDGADGAMFLWNYWHLPWAVLHGHDPFTTTRLFWPVGVRLGFHTTTPLEATAVWLLGRVMGSVLAVNLVNLAAVPLTGLAMWLLARHECHDDRVAFFAGAAFMLLPQHTGRIEGHWNLNHAWVLPLGLWLLLRLYDRPTWWRAIALGLVAGAVFLTDLTYFVFWLGASMVVAGWRWRDTLRVWAKLAAGAVVAAAVSAPLLVAMGVDLARHELDRLPQWGGAQEHSADLVSWIIPSSRHPLWGGLFDSVSTKGNIFGLEEYAYVGLLVLALAIVALGRQRRLGLPLGPWPLLAAGSMVLALGPYLHVNGWTGTQFERFGDRFSVPLPFFVFHTVPVLSALRIPGRFAIVAGLALDLMAAVLLARLIRGRPPRWQWGAVAVALTVTCVELLPGPRTPLQSRRVPAAYAAVRGPGAVLEIPLFWRDGFGQIGDDRNDDLFLYYATRHHHPLVNGMVSRLPNKRRAALYAVPVYRQVLALQYQKGFTDTAVFTAADLRTLGIGFVVYHRSRPMPGVLGYVEGLGLDQVADDGDVIVWRVPRVPAVSG